MARQTKGRYKAWYDANLAALYPRLTAEDCYALRCGVVHQGQFGHPNMQYSRILFTIRNAQKNIFHNNLMNDALNLDVVIFTRDMVAAARRWFIGARFSENVRANLPRLMQMRPMGLAPYMVGIPLIA